MATVRRIGRWGKLDVGTPVKTLIAKLNAWMLENDNAIVGGAKGDDALNTSAELTTNVTDAATIAGKPALGVAVTYASEFMETFDTTPASWITVSGTVSYTLSGTGQTGGKALRQTGSLTIAFPYALPYDGSKLHRLRARVKNVTGAGTFSFGLRAIDNTGAVIGTYAVAASAAAPGTSYVEYTGWVKATAVPTTPAADPTAPSGMPSGTVGIQPYVVLNGGAPSGVMDLDYVSYERQDEDATHRTYKSLIPTTDPRFASGARLVNNGVDTGAVQATAVTEPKMADASISTRCVRTDIVITGKVVSADDPTNIYIDMRTGANPVIKVPGLTVTPTAATFSGSLSAASGTFAGTVSAGGTIAASSFTATTASFSGFVSAVTGFQGGYLRVDSQSGNPWGYTISDIGGGVVRFAPSTGQSTQFTGSLGFYGATPGAQPTITGSRGGNAALASLLTALAGLGLIVDSST